MEPDRILQNIVNSNGSCQWIGTRSSSRSDICSACPLSKLKKTPDGRWMGCVEAIAGPHPENAGDSLRSKYRKVAEEKLADMGVDILVQIRTDD